MKQKPYFLMFSLLCTATGFAVALWGQSPTSIGLSQLQHCVTGATLVSLAQTGGGTTTVTNVCVALDPNSFSIVPGTPTSLPVLTLKFLPSPNVFVYGEVPAGVVDGVNRNFTVAGVPVLNSIRLHRNGLRMSTAVDYAVLGQTITFAAGAQPQPGDVLVVDYNK